MEKNKIWFLFLILNKKIDPINYSFFSITLKFKKKKNSFKSVIVAEIMGFLHEL